MEIFNKSLNDPAYKAKAVSGLGYAYAKLEQPEKSVSYLKQLEDMDTEDVPLDMDRAIVYTGLGDWDKVFNLLNSAIDKRLGGLNFINGKYWKEIHDHPKFKELLQRMNLPVE